MKNFVEQEEKAAQGNGRINLRFWSKRRFMSERNRRYGPTLPLQRKEFLQSEEFPQAILKSLQKQQTEILSQI